jgi:lantibiotic modifying enzyme
MRQLVQNQLDRLSAIIGGSTSRNDSFIGGQLGLTYYYYHLYKVTGEQEYKTKVDKLLGQVFANINSSCPRLIGTSFASGGAGLGFVMNTLSMEGAVPFNIDQEFEELDKYLFDTASYQMEDDFIDFLHGALGTIHYFTQRSSSAVTDYYLDQLICKMCRRVQKRDAGYWFSNYLLNYNEKQNINFGLSHGQCGFLLILLNAFPRSAHKDLIEGIVLEGIRFIRKYKMDVDFSNDEYSAFPFRIEEGANEISAPNRMGWCYGDLNEVLLFYRAGKLFKKNDLISLADVIGAQTLLRKSEKATMVQDSSFCHGAVGLAQFYRQLYVESKQPVYLQGQEYWIEQSMLLLEKDLSLNHYAGREHGMLDGLVGVALTFLSYVTSFDLVWSKCLLL